VLAHSGRKIAYSRLRVTDATGKELPARIEVCPVGDEATSLNSSDLFGDELKSPLTSAPTSGTLAVVVNDAEAVYPVRIDPTFSDANWVSMGGFPGANGEVNAAVIDGSGNLYIGGVSQCVGNAIANGIAQWNGSSWSALGSGMNVARCMRWRCRAARCMRAAISRRRAAARPITSRNGTGAVGRPSVRG
jgi:hypothetical protein